MTEHANAADLTKLGIVQHPSAVLATPTIPYELPREADLARIHCAELRRVALEVYAIHPTPKGLGIAAPQLGINRRIAFLYPGEHNELCLLNPEITAQSAATDMKYEGCMSLWDARGLVPRSLSLTVRTQSFDGDYVDQSFDNRIARLVAHEIDHLDGRLYIDITDEPPISADEYRSRGNTDWVY